MAYFDHSDTYLRSFPTTGILLADICHAQLDEYLADRTLSPRTCSSHVLPKTHLRANRLSQHPAFHLLEPVYESAQCLKQCALDAELRLAVTELTCLIWNYRHFPPNCRTLEDAIGATFPARNWLRFIPNAPKRLAEQDFGALMLVAHWETFFFLILNMASLDEYAFFVKDREITISNLLQRLVNPLPIPGRGTGITGPIGATDLKQQSLRERVRLKWVSLAQATLEACRSCENMPAHPFQLNVIVNN